MTTHAEEVHKIKILRPRDPNTVLRGGARGEPTTPSGTRRIWKPPADTNGAEPDENIQ